MAAEKRRRKRPSSGPIAELIVRRGALRRYDRLKQATADLPVKVSWDRRLQERRTSEAGVARDRRRKDRREPPPFTWEAADFLVVAKRTKKPV